MEAPDEELMLAYRDGDAGAFETLYARHRGALYRFVLRSLKDRDRALAEELFQEAWIRVIEARERYAPSARFKTWLYTIAHNLLVDHWRRKGLTLVESDEEPVSSDNPASQAEARQGLARFLQALEGLPPVQREAFLLHEEGGMSAAEIAAATGTNEEAAKSRLRYALMKLRNAVSDG
ncbi:MAG TPA: sigma-70 family RNA polymerase sigma factor [Burkholderiales bacterium]|nr:sigma-70 family RNA polymerase sigma factor [Burkholderiales bacterium]